MTITAQATRSKNGAAGLGHIIGGGRIRFISYRTTAVLLIVRQSERARVGCNNPCNMELIVQLHVLEMHIGHPWRLVRPCVSSSVCFFPLFHLGYTILIPSYPWVPQRPQLMLLLYSAYTWYHIGKKCHINTRRRLLYHTDKWMCICKQ